MAQDPLNELKRIFIIISIHCSTARMSTISKFPVWRFNMCREMVQAYPKFRKSNYSAPHTSSSSIPCNQCKTSNHYGTEIFEKETHHVKVVRRKGGIYTGISNAVLCNGTFDTDIRR